MTLQECYAALGGNYKDVLGRLQMEKLVSKFVLKFLNDGSYDLLCRSLEEKNYEEAFRAAHTIKGVCANLAFNTLLGSSEALTEALRDGRPPQPGEEELIARVNADYDRAYRAIQEFQAGVSE